MKIKSDGLKKTFAPLTLTITIETAEELAEMWHRFNINKSRLLDAGYDGTKRYVPWFDLDLSYDLWKHLDKLAQKVWDLKRWELTNSFDRLS